MLTLYTGSRSEPLASTMTSASLSFRCYRIPIKVKMMTRMLRR